MECDNKDCRKCVSAIKMSDDPNDVICVGDTFEIEITGETTGIESDDVIHNHIDRCPICKKTDTSTDSCSDMDCDVLGKTTCVTCEECMSLFVLVENKWYDDPKVVVAVIGTKHLNGGGE